MATIAEVYTEAQALLNDVLKDVYTDAAILPFVKKAYDELCRKFQANGLQVNREVSSTLTVPASTVILNGVAGFPADFLYPIKLEERQQGSVSEADFRLVREYPFEQDTHLDPQTVIGAWAFRENDVKLRSCTVIREVRLSYIKSLAVIVDGTTVIAIIDAKNFLAARAAAVAVFVIGQNATIASALTADADIISDELISVNVLKAQSLPVRRLPFRRKF